MVEQVYEYVCSQCSTVELMQKWRNRQKKYPNLCKQCSINLGRDRYRNIKENDPSRWQTITLIKQETAKKKHAAYTSEQRTTQAKYRNSCIVTDRSESRKKQQSTIESDPVRYHQYCEKRRKIAVDFHKNMTDEEKEQHYRKVLKRNGRSKECDMFLRTLRERGINVDPEIYINGFIVDGLIDNKVIVEYYGEMFHCDPRRFKDPSQVCSWLGNRTVQEQWDRDRKRLAVLYKNGYNVVIVWSKDWKNDKEHQINRILEIIGVKT